MDVEEQLVVLVIREALLKLARDGPVGRTHVAVQDLAQHGVHVRNLGQLDCAPVVQQARPLLDDQLSHTCFSGVGAVVEGARVEP